MKMPVCKNKKRCYTSLSNYTRTCMETMNALKKSKDYALGKKIFHIDIYLDFSRKSININEYICEKMFFFQHKNTKKRDQTKCY